MPHVNVFSSKLRNSTAHICPLPQGQKNRFGFPLCSLAAVVNYCFAAGVRDINIHIQHARGVPQETTASVKIKGKARGITGNVAF